MDADGENYWQMSVRRRISRRALLHGAVVAGGGLASVGLLACNSSKSTSSGGSAGPPKAGSQSGQAQGANALIGRTGKKPTEAPTTGGTYIDITSSNAPTLDPHGTPSVLTMSAVSAVMSRLLRYKQGWDVAPNYNRETEPDLAMSAESPDAITWTFKLRSDAKFQNIAPVNGHAVEAEDVKQTFLRATSAKNSNRGSLGMIDPDQILTPDKSTVVFKLKYPYAPFSKLMASGVYAWIFPREGARDAYDPAKTIIGSGPFTLESYTPDVSYVYKKSPDWFEKGRPYIDGAKRVIVTDPNAQIAQFTAGNLDYIQSAVNDDNLAEVQKQNPTAETLTTWGPGDGQIYFPLGSDTNSPFKDIRLRRAISLLLDRSTMTKVAFNDRAAPTFYANHSFGKWSLNLEDLPADTAQYYKYNVQQAKQLVEAAGATKLSIKLLGPSPLPPTGEAVWFRKMREMVYNFLKVLPWEVNLVLIDYNKDWMNSGKGVRYGNFPSPNDSIVWGPLEGRQDIDEYLFGWYHSKSSTNLSHLDDPNLDAMIDKARTIVSEEDRVKAYVDTQKYMADQMFSVAGNPGGLAYYVIRPRIRNYSQGDNYGVGTANWGQLWLTK